MKSIRILLAGLLSACSFCAAAQTIEVSLAKPGAPVQPTMYGIFFEDINFAADRGL